MSKTEELIERIYPKVKALVDLAGMTKDQWIEESHRKPEKKLKRCENCALWKCDAIKRLEKNWSWFIEIWHDWGCSACSEFILKTEDKEN